jgi:hypothetical protein
MLFLWIKKVRPPINLMEGVSPVPPLGLSPSHPTGVPSGYDMLREGAGGDDVAKPNR